MESNTNSTQIREGMSMADVHKAGGGERTDGSIFDQNGHNIWTTRGDLHNNRGTAEPRKPSEGSGSSGSADSDRR